MSAELSPMCGKAGAVLSILTASTEPPSPSRGRPVNGEVAAWVVDSVGATDTLGDGWGVALSDPPQAATVPSTARAATEARTERVRGVRGARKDVITPGRVRGDPAVSAPARRPRRNRCPWLYLSSRSRG